MLHHQLIHVHDQYPPSYNSSSGNEVQASCVFRCIMNLLFHGAVLPQMAYLPAQEALLGVRPVASRCSTQLHWDDVPTISGLATEPLSSVTMLPSMLRSIPRQKPYRAINGVSSMHGIMQRSRMLHHDLLLHLRFQTTQVSHKYVLR